MLIIYAIIAGMLVEVPESFIRQTIRNLFYHVGMWFAMAFSLTVSLIYSICFLSGFQPKNDIVAKVSARVGLYFGFIGIITGMVWANYTWGALWVNDPKLNGAGVGILVYLAYMVLRTSVEDDHKRGKLAAVYNIFAYTIMIVFVMILPRLSGASIHPGSDSSVLLPVNMDYKLQLVFYPAAIGWMLTALWIITLSVRYENEFLKSETLSRLAVAKHERSSEESKKDI